MSETISHTWQTVEHAAVTLNVSTRTIARRLANGSLESRVDENGRRLVMVQVFSQANITNDTADAATTDLSHSSAAEPSTAVIAHPSDMTAPMLAVLETTIETLRVDQRRAKTAAQWAWLGVGVMGLGVLAVAVLLTASLTKSSMLEKNVADARTELTKAQADLMTEHGALAVAEHEKNEAEQSMKVAADQEKGRDAKFAALKPVLINQPTTRPATFFSQIATILNEDQR